MNVALEKATGLVYKNGRIVGEIHQQTPTTDARFKKKPFYTSIRSIEHIFRNGYATVAEAKQHRAAAWGMDEEVLDVLEAAGVGLTIIVFKNGHQMLYYECPLEIWKEMGTQREFRNQGPQWFIVFGDFLVTDRHHRIISAWT